MSTKKGCYLIQLLTVNNDAALEPVMSRVADEEKYVHETDQAGFASPALIVDQNFPRMDIAIFQAR